MILIFFQYSVVLVGWDGGNWSERGGGVGVLICITKLDNYVGIEREFFANTYKKFFFFFFQKTNKWGSSSTS